MRHEFKALFFMYRLGDGHVVAVLGVGVRFSFIVIITQRCSGDSTVYFRFWGDERAVAAVIGWRQICRQQMSLT